MCVFETHSNTCNIPCVCVYSKHIQIHSNMTAKSVGQCGQLACIMEGTGFRVYGGLHLTREMPVRNWGRLEFLSGQKNGHMVPTTSKI